MSEGKSLIVINVNFVHETNEYVGFITNLPYHEVISHNMCTNDAIKTKYGLDSIISALFMRNHLKTWQIGIEIHIYEALHPCTDRLHFLIT